MQFRKLALSRLSAICFGVTIGLALSVLYGWYRNIQPLKSAFEPAASMKINTALGVALLAAAGWLTHHDRHRRRRLVAGTLTLVVVLMVLMTFMEDIFHVNWGIDEVLGADTDSLKTRWPPGRPSPMTLLSLLLLSGTLLGRMSRHRTLRRISEILLTCGWIVPFQALVSFIEGVNSDFGMAIYIQMAPHTAFCFGMISTGLLLSRPYQGLMIVLRGKTQADQIGRLLLTFALALPPTLVWLERMGHAHQWWDRDFGAIVRIVAQATLLSWVALKTASTLRRTEIKESQTQQKLQMAVNSRDEFLSIASHELKTPLTSIKLQNQMMERSLLRGDNVLFAPDKVGQLLRQNIKNLNLMTHLIDDMLDVARIQNGKIELKLEPTDFGGFVRTCLDNFSLPLAQAGVALQIQAEPGVVVPLDRVRMDQVLANLVTNVIRYAPGAPLEVRLAAREHSARLQFADHGPGIKPENQDKIFQRFERLISANEVSGMGLGLYITRNLILAHQGTIQVKSQEGQGACFEIELPC